MPNRDRQSVEDMLRAAKRALEYCKGATRETLPSVPMRLDAVLYEVVVVGEAARRVSDNLRKQYDVIRWRDIIGMRSVVTHGYDQIDDDELWQVIERDLPALVSQLEGVLGSLPHDNQGA